MQRSPLPFLLGLTLLWMGCSPSLDVAGRGLLQKRKYQPGWHIEWASGSGKVIEKAEISVRADRAQRHALVALPDTQRTCEESAWSLSTGLQHADQDPTRLFNGPTIGSALPSASPVSNKSKAVMRPINVLNRQGPLTSTKPDPSMPEELALPTWAATGQAPDQDPPSTEGPRWNRMAIVSGIFLILSMTVLAISGGTGILLYLLTFSFLTGLIGLILAIKHEQKGKGIAIAAIAFPLVIITLVLAGFSASW